MCLQVPAESPFHAHIYPLVLYQVGLKEMPKKPPTVAIAPNLTKPAPRTVPEPIRIAQEVRGTVGDSGEGQEWNIGVETGRIDTPR